MGLLPDTTDDFRQYLLRRTGGDERDFPAAGGWGARKALCRRCGLVMNDRETSTSTGEFLHLAKPHQKRALRCKNAGLWFETTSREIEPFLPKARRRFLRRAGIRP